MVMKGRSNSLIIFIVDHNLVTQFEMKICLISSENKVLDYAN